MSDDRWNPLKRAITLQERGLDFADADEMFCGTTIDIPDTRFDYGEERIVSVGHINGRMMIVVWTLRDGKRRYFSMRKANDREQKRYAARLAQG